MLPGWQHPYRSDGKLHGGEHTDGVANRLISVQG
jgi:hypothetical protein